jgi:hypothetical protein
MMQTTHRIKIEHEKFGVLLDEVFVDSIQFKIFLKTIHGCLELKNNMTFFNGDDFLFNIPYKFLCESIIITSVGQYDLVEQMKSKVEALVTR